MDNDNISVLRKALALTYEENIEAAGGPTEEELDEPIDIKEVYKALSERWEKIMKDHHERHRRAI